MPLQTKAVAVAVAILAVGALAGGGAVAHAHDVNHPSEVSLTFTDREPDGADTFDGRVLASDVHRCQPNRTVRVVRATPGPVFMGAATTLGPPRKGFWSLELEDPPDGTYYARVVRKDLDPRPAHAHICQAAGSADLLVDDG